MTGPADTPFESFWDRAYRAGDHREHWEAPSVPGELAALVAAGPLIGLRPGDSALDVGCGTGQEAVYLAEAGLSVIAVDSSRPALELARERAAAAGVELDLRRGSAFDLPVASATVDLALDRGCLHGIEPEERPEYAAEIARVLASGGLFLLRGARADDEEAGLFAVDETAVDALFPAPRFTRGPVVPVVLAAPAGDLPGSLALLCKAG
jgi:SAM-dependent methyltransferase